MSGVKGWSIVFRGGRIQADGLQVEVFGDHAYGVGINLTDAVIMVPDDQAETAREIIRQADQQLVDPEAAPDV